MKEVDYLKETKEKQRKLMQYITPEKLRLFIAEKVGKVDTIFDGCVGSGQLLFNINARVKLGNDIDKESSIIANENGIKTTNEDYILLDDSNINYDTAISNYPFGLRATEEQKKYLESIPLINKLTNGKFSGYLDFMFIYKMFLLKDSCKKGYFLCGSGIGYRGGKELQFRKYLIDNNYIEEITILEDCGFDNTKIPILYLKLNKDKINDKIKVRKYINYELIVEKEITLEDIKQEGYSLTVERFLDLEETEEEIDIQDINKQINIRTVKSIKDTYEMNKLIVLTVRGEPEDFMDKFIYDLEHVIRDIKKDWNNIREKKEEEELELLKLMQQ